MKKYLDSSQTARLITMGFSEPKSVHKLSLDIDMDTVPHFGYSIGDLIDFLPKKIYDEDEDVMPTLQISSGWEVFYSTYTDIFYYQRDEELIDALFSMVVQLKEKGLI